MDGVSGVRPANIVVIGGSAVGTAAACVAIGANVTAMVRSVQRLSDLDDIFMGS